MNPKLSNVKTALAFFLLLSFLPTAQAQRYRPLDWTYPVPAWPGYAVMCDGDTAKGLIKVLPLISTWPLMDTTTKQLRYLGYPFVVYVRVYENAPGGTYTDYVNLRCKHRLWRLDAQQKNIALYDDESRGTPPHVLLYTPTRKIKLYTTMCWLLHNGGPTAESNENLLVRFINKRYKTHRHVADFHSTAEIFNYILTKENEREDNSQNLRKPK